MAFGIKSWKLNTYTAGAWTDLVAGTAGNETVKRVVISNPSISDITLTVQVATSGGVKEAIIIPPLVLLAGAVYVLDLDPLNLVGSQKLQISASLNGLEFYASGVTHS